MGGANRGGAMSGGANIGPTPMEIFGPLETEAPGPGAGDGDRGGGGIALRGAAPPMRPPLRAACAPSSGANITAIAATAASATRATWFSKDKDSPVSVVSELLCLAARVLRT